MNLRRGKGFECSPRAVLVCVLSGFLTLAALTLPAYATLLPKGFFDQVPTPGQGSAAVEADRLSYDAKSDEIAAEGDVLLSYQGYSIRAASIRYNQKTGAMTASGGVAVKDPAGDVFQMDSIEVSGGIKDAFINSLTLTTSAGALVTAKDVHYSSTLATILTEAAYTPCGLCQDAKGRTIGWKVKTARMYYDHDHASVTLEQPTLELLGIPVAWLPWFWVPDPTQPRARGLRMPKLDWDWQRGASLAVPYFVPVGQNLDVVLTPELMSRQGALMGGEINWRLPNFGSIDIKASGLYQLDPGAYAGKVGDRDWRGAIQTSGKFTPAAHWKAGWSYSTFTDNAYLTDYDFTNADSSVNEVYGTYLNDMTYLDMRVQRFNRLGNYTAADDDKQAMNAPLVSFDHIQELAPGYGRAHISGELLSTVRNADQTGTRNGVDYVFGNQGYKQHLMLEAGWENQYVLPGGVTATPYLGARLDAASYDRTTPAIPAPYPTTPDSTLLSLTPIAAMDFRWPLVAHNGLDTHLLEPIAQLVYRGSSTTAVGITNDDAQSFVFDTSNLFSYNKFSGIDRQETGLRANIGGHYLGNFADGSWLDLIAGQSFFLAGTNALGITDASQVGTDTGLGSTASYFVASAQGGWSNGISGGAKLQLDTTSFKIARAGVGVNYVPGNGWTAGADYIYIAPQPALGTVLPQHEITGRVGVPVYDYWTLAAGLTYNLDKMDWYKASTGLTYDDGYLKFGVDGHVTNYTKPSFGVGVTFALKGPDRKSAF